jgi:glycoside/pentoside/hexuronide:cation symporter, GPH family
VNTPGERRRPALYSAGSLGGSLLLQAIMLWIIYFYAPPPGQGLSRLSPGLIGLALAAGRMVNALTNPVAAYWSDRVRTRWGRRRPFMALGTPPLIACFALLWTPPDAGPRVTFLYLLFVLVGFFFFFSLVLNPYAALLPEITPQGRGRVSTAAWQAGAALGGVGITTLASPWLIARGGFATMGAAFGAAAFVVLWAVPAGITEPEPGPVPATDRFITSMAAVIRNRAFMVYLLCLTLLWLGTSMVNSTIVYVITVLMGLPRDQVGVVLGAAFACTLAAFPILTRASHKFGTITTLGWTLGAASLVVPLIGAIGFGAPPLSPAIEGYAVVVLAAAPLAGLLVLPNSLLADIAERARIESGTGREAMFYAVQGLVLNTATALASLLLGMLLGLGYSPGHALGLRLIPVVAGIATCLSLLVFRRFPVPPNRRPRGAPSR